MPRRRSYLYYYLLLLLWNEHIIFSGNFQIKFEKPTDNVNEWAPWDASGPQCQIIVGPCVSLLISHLFILLSLVFGNNIYIYIYIYSLIKYSIISFKFNGIQKTIEIKHLLVFINTTITFSVCALKNNDYLTYRNNKTKRSLHKSSNV